MQASIGLQVSLQNSNAGQETTEQRAKKSVKEARHVKAISILSPDRRKTIFTSQYFWDLLLQVYIGLGVVWWDSYEEQEKIE